MEPQITKPERQSLPRRSATAPATGAGRPALRKKSRDQHAGEDRYRLIAEAAYFRAESRGFKPGQELEDWLAAEIEVDELLAAVDARA